MAISGSRAAYQIPLVPPFRENYPIKNLSRKDLEEMLEKYMQSCPYPDMHLNYEKTANKKRVLDLLCKGIGDSTCSTEMLETVDCRLRTWKMAAGINEEGQKVREDYFFGLDPCIEGARKKVYRVWSLVRCKIITLVVPINRCTVEEEWRKAAILRSCPHVAVSFFPTPASSSFKLLEYAGVDLFNWQGAKILNSLQCVELISQVCVALVALHDLHLVHGDIKPENIMIRPDNQVRLIDWETLEFEGAVCKKDFLLYRTAFYVAPELLQPVPKISCLNDIWSLGIVAFRCLEPNVVEGYRDQEARASGPTAALEYRKTTVLPEIISRLNSWRSLEEGRIATIILAALSDIENRPPASQIQQLLQEALQDISRVQL